LIWQYPFADEVENRPGKWFWASLVIHDNTIYAANMDGMVYVFDAGSGNLITALDLGSSISSSPAVADDKVFIATEEGRVYYIDTNGNQTRELPVLGGIITAPLTASDGVVYVHAFKDEVIYAINAETGVIIWNTPIS
jgi:outer membrane protein assembly factor BamB